ncbi:MAG: DUF1588 domain-containing protein [Zavarzinella sp.]
MSNSWATVIAFGVWACVSQAAEPLSDSFKSTYDKTVRPFLTQHCFQCHGEMKQASDVRLDRLAIEGKIPVATWAGIRDQIRDGLMPPKKEPRPNQTQSRQVVAWISALVAQQPSRLPNEGNLIPHELLFQQKPAEDAATPARIWRIHPQAYMNLVQSWAKDAPGISQPFTLIDERGIRDFANLYAADIPSTEILVRNAEAVVTAQTTKEMVIIPRRDPKSSELPKPERRPNPRAIKEFVQLIETAQPTPEQLQRAVRTQFRMAIGWQPTEQDVARYLALYEKCRRQADSPTAVRTMLQAVLLNSQTIFRTEMGGGQGQRKLLTPPEMVRAISFSLGYRLDRDLQTMLEKGQLTSHDEMLQAIKKVLANPKTDSSRIMQFFREYFEYDLAADVFKDNPKDSLYFPRAHINDTELLISHILKQDREVLRELLTTQTTFANARYDKKRNVIQRAEARTGGVDPKTGKFTLSMEGIYGFDKWPEKQPAVMPENTRIGILMQPSWLISWSTNFDNDPVRRGRWIRERLLGGTVPDLPIGVVAQVPDDPHRTFRDRLQVTRAAECWKCHQRMDDLGLPLEQFDHYGRFRTTERVLYPEATAKNLDIKGKSKGDVYREVALDTTGRIADSGDPELDGVVADPREMMHRLAKSERVRQVFIRHVFRFFMGRNESLADASTLQAADEAYVRSGGSFNALLESIFTSDSFLYRKQIARVEP